MYLRRPRATRAHDPRELNPTRYAGSTRTQGLRTPVPGRAECRPHTVAGSRPSSVSARRAYSDTRGTFPERGSCLRKPEILAWVAVAPRSWPRIRSEMSEPRKRRPQLLRCIGFVRFRLRPPRADGPQWMAPKHRWAESRARMYYKLGLRPVTLPRLGERQHQPSAKR